MDLISQRLKTTLLKNKYFLAIIFLLSLFTTIAAISAVISYRISIEGSRHLLETRATDIAVNLGFSLERLGLNPELFPDLVSSDRWEYLAFLALIDKDMTCILHSNEKLIGRRINDPSIKKVFKQERIVTHFEKLATGEEVFILDFPLKLHLEEVNRMQDDHLAPLSKQGPQLKPLKPKPELRIYCLRVALHPWPAFSIERKAKFQLVMILFSILLLWLMAVFFIRAWKRNYQLEKSLAEKERMAALGKMAAVLAHEIRNPLSTIKGFAQIHLEESGDEDLREDMEIIVQQVARLERLTANLLIYARPTELYVESFDIQDLCRDIKRLLPGDKEETDIEISCQGELVSSDKEKLIQIILNLVQNSLEALAGVDANKKIRVLISANDDGLILKVEDSGPGFPGEGQERLFQPFFTTKTKGTGLGLAIVKRLVEAMNGHISIGKSELGGALVEIFIPALEED